MSSFTNGRTSTLVTRAYLSEIFVSAQGEGPRTGERHLFVRFAGCNLRCTYCDTPESLTKIPACSVDFPDGERRVLDNPIDVNDLSDIVEDVCIRDPSVRMIAITGGEPMVQHGFIIHWLESSPPPVPCLLETNAVVIAGLERVLQGVFMVSADIKLPSNSGEGPQWERHEEFLAGCARTGTETYVKMPIDQATSEEEVRRGARLVSRLLPGAYLFLQPLQAPGGPLPTLNDPAYAPFFKVASAEHGPVRLQPQMHKVLGIR